MISEHEFIQERLATVQEQLRKGSPDILRKRDAEIAIEKNCYDSEMRLLQHISRTVPEGKIAIALRQWKTKFHTMTEEYYRRHKDKIDYYEKRHALPFHLQGNFPPLYAPAASAQRSFWE